MRYVSCLGATARRFGNWPHQLDGSVTVSGHTCAPLVCLATCFFFAGIWTTPATQSAHAAQRSDAPLTIIAGSPDETTLTIANDIANALGEASRTRILAIVGRGSLANMSDLSNLQNIDLAITQTDALAHLKAAGTLGPALDTRIGILAKLHDAELHILAGKDIERIEDLAGKTVNLCAPDSGTEFTARAILDRLGLKVRSINLSHNLGLAKVASGEIAATLLVTGKPAHVLQGRALPAGVKFLGLPFAPQFDDAYMPATLTEADYPGLIEPGQRVDTLAVGVILAAPMPAASEARTERITNFIDTFFSEIATLHGPAYHPKWRDINLSGSLPGWKRHPAAESWLTSHGSASAPEPAPSRRSALAQATGQIEGTANSDPMLAFAEATRAANGNPAEQERLFKAFLEKNRPPQAASQPAKTASTTPSP